MKNVVQGKYNLKHYKNVYFCKVYITLVSTLKNKKEYAPNPFLLIKLESVFAYKITFFNTKMQWTTRMGMSFFKFVCLKLQWNVIDRVWEIFTSFYSASLSLSPLFGSV